MGSGSSSQVRSIGDGTNNASVPVVRSSTTHDKGQVIKTTKATVNAEASSTKMTPSSTVTPLKPVSFASHPSESTPGSSKGSSQSGLELKLEQVEKELAESESEKLDLLDRIQALEERLQELTSSAAVSAVDGNGKDAGSAAKNCGDLEETLNAKDHYIQQLERQLTAVQANSNKVRARLKKKVKTLTAQLSEARQECSIAHLELKERNANLQDQLHQSQAADKHAVAAAAPEREDDDKESSKFKVILDLSAQVSDQAEKISELQRLLKERDTEVEQLKQIASSQTLKSKNTTTDYSERAQGGSGNKVKQGVGQTFSSQDSGKVQNSRNVTFSGTGASSMSGFTPVEPTAGHSGAWQRGQRPISKIGRRDVNGPVPVGGELTLQRQSTALSDSDSDWEVDMSSSKIRSAPARMRVKSAAAMAEDKSRDDTDLDDKWSLVTDDNDLILTAEAQPARGSSGRQKRRSALKNKLERERNERAKGLMGPSLAFGAPTGDQMTDTSCNNTPSVTPRASHAGFGSTSSDVMSFAV